MNMNDELPASLDLNFLFGDPSEFMRSESVDSNMSNITALTMECHDDDVDVLDQDVIIQAFFSHDDTLVDIKYPCADDGWKFRPDHGGYSMLRWDYGTTACLVAKHSTCSKAMVPKKQICRNCVMKKTWRRECSDASNTFYFFALGDVAHSSHLILKSLSLSAADVRMYTNFMPKLANSSSSRSLARDQAKIMRMNHMERNLYYTISISNSGRRIQKSAGDELFHLLMYDAEDAEESKEERKDDQEQADDGEAHTLSSFTLSAPVGPLAAPVARVPPVVATVLVSSPSRKLDVARMVYEILLDKLIDFGPDLSVVFCPNTTLKITTLLPIGFQGITRLENNTYTSHLYTVLDIQSAPQLLIKTSLLVIWITRIVEEKQVYIGFLSIPSMHLFHEMRTLPLLPAACTEAEIHMHCSFALAANACVPGTHPILCAYHSPHAPNRVYSANVLPLAV